MNYATGNKIAYPINISDVLHLELKELSLIWENSKVQNEEINEYGYLRKNPHYNYDWGTQGSQYI
jgi:hypothetical protein